MMPHVLLQTAQERYVTQVNSPENLIFLVIMIAVIGLFLFMSMRGGSKSGGSAFALRKQCKIHGLDPDQYRILKHAIKAQSIATPALLFTNGRFLNGTLKQLLQQIDSSQYSDQEKETLKAELYDIKQKIAQGNPTQNQAVHSKSMPMNQEVMIYSKAFPPFKSEMTGKTGEVLALNLPKDSHGDWIQYKVGSAVKVRYIRDEDKVFSFMTTVRDIREIEGDMKLLIAHSADVKRIQLRKSPRKEIHRTAFYYRVEIITEGKGRKETRKAAVDKSRKYSGTMQDLSAGGCALFARTPFPKGSLVMISFDIAKGSTVNVFGKVRHLHKERAGALMHVMFTRVSTRHLNEIRAFVFGFSDDEKPRNQLLI